MEETVFRELSPHPNRQGAGRQRARAARGRGPGVRAAAMDDDEGGAGPVQLPGEKPFIVRWVQKNPKAVDALLYFVFLIVFTLIVFNAQGQPTDASPRRWRIQPSAICERHEL